MNPEDVLYRAGRGGVTITAPDGTVTSYPARAIIALPIDRGGYTIVGRLYRLSRHGRLVYEAPVLEVNV